MTKEKDIVGHGFIAEQKIAGGKGFSLIELLVVLSIISVLYAILMPALAKIRQQARNIVSMANQKQIANTVTFYAFDHDDKYPESVATIGVLGIHANWQEPMMMTGTRALSPRFHRSMSGYLKTYIEDSSILFCPNATKKPEYFQQAWDAGDDWDNPETILKRDSVVGSYCFYWNYLGYLEEQKRVFVGPKGPAGGIRQSTLLMSCYFGYNHWRSPEAFGSCEQFKDSQIIPETWVSSAYWSPCKPANCFDTGNFNIKLRAVFTDGHVETFSASDVVPMRVAITIDGKKPYPNGVGAGIIYLPKSAVR